MLTARLPSDYTCLPEGHQQVHLKRQLVVREMAQQPGIIVSFRQACMNWGESSGIVGCRRGAAWRTADENWNDRRFSRWVGINSPAF